jgi:hypothetical protein
MANLTLTASEMSALATELQGYAPAQSALDTLQQHHGNLMQALAAQLIEEVGTREIYSERSLWEITQETLREELCGKEGFLGRVQKYLDEPKKATALTALVIYIVEQTTLPISLSLATLLALYITKVGLTIFCKYTEPTVGP